jgi:hypothetical protein
MPLWLNVEGFHTRMVWQAEHWAFPVVAMWLALAGVHELTTAGLMT